MSQKKFLDKIGLQNFLNRIKALIPTKTSELQNDSGFITSEGTYDSALSLESEKAVQNKVVTAAINGKQDSLSTAQTNAVNSGITSAKVQGYDSHISDTDIHVTQADKTSWDSKASGTHTHTASDVSGLSTVATSGDYSDLLNKPTIPTVNNKTLTIQKNSANVATFTANSASDVTANITVPTKVSELTNDSGFLTSHNPVDSALSDTSTNAVQNKVVKGALDGKSDTGHTHTKSEITDFPTLATVATSGSYNDLTNKPTIPTVNNATLTIQKNGTTVKTFTANASSNVTANITVPTKVSELTNDSGFLTSASSLDSSKLTGTIDIARLPKGSLERLVTVADQTARFALTTSDVQLGDTVKQLDTGVMYIVTDESKLNSADGYTEYTAGAATSVPWSGVTGKPSSYTPASHTHGNIANGGTLGTASMALITDGNKKITTSSVTSTELGYLSGVTSAIQTQLDGKAPSSHTHTASEVSGLATVATSGSYNDLSNKPTIPTVNNATLTIQKNGTTVKTFTANASSNVTANITVPTKTSELTNDSGYLTSHQSLSNYSTLANTVKSLSISGKTITVTPGSGSAYTLTTQDTVYTHPTTSGNKHIPSGGSSGQFLGWDSDGTAKWVNNPNTNTDTLMTQNVSTTNATYPVLLVATADATANQGAKTGIFAKSVKVNPSTNVISASGFSGPLTGNVTGNCSGSSGSCTGNSATATQFSANTTVALTGDATGTSAGSKKGWSVPVTLANSGVTAGTYGPSADVTGNNNATISVPEITVDAKGRVTSVTNRTLTCKNNTYTVNNATLTIQKNGTNVATFTSNASANATANITVPTKTSQLTNDSGYLTSHQSLANYLTKTTNVSEMGRYIDLHYDNATAAYDYDARIFVDSQGTAKGGGALKISAATAYAPAPASDANDTRIATTKWVKDRGYLTSHQSLSDYSTKANTVKSLSISGKTITVTPGSGSAYTLTTQDTVYTHPTTAGNKHIPSGGSSGQILKYSAAGTAAWTDATFGRTLSEIYNSGELTNKASGSWLPHSVNITCVVNCPLVIFFNLTTNSTLLLDITLSNIFVIATKMCIGTQTHKQDDTAYSTILSMSDVGSVRGTILAYPWSTTVKLTTKLKSGSGTITSYQASIYQ